MSASNDPPDRIGPYRIESVLGEGGMGVVYAAEQTEPVRRRVALKLIRGGTAGDDIAARFDAERQALAVMEHPGIARVLDAGTTPGGSPYFVMEYVDGTPLTYYCDERELGLDERLALFVEVCDAIQHAHQKGVIHRDLKPSNILVTEQAGSPLPKIIDFGIAKAVGTKLTEKTLATSMGQVLGTPAYMSPEQAEGTGLDVDTRADVYALGVILYELLVGVVPIDPDDLGFLQFMTRLITDDVPTPRPSGRLDDDPGRATTTASRRRTTPERLRRRLTGDLDWIAMKAIETDRERRYGSARGLAGDVGRYLRDEPVLARPPSTSYRLRKFVRRHRAAVTGGIAALVLLVGGTIASAIGLVRASRAEAAATAQGEIARREAVTANEASSFLVELFQNANPGRSGRPDITARELLDMGVANIEEQLADQPVIQARLLSTMGDSYRGVGLWERTVELKRRALELRETALGPDDPAVARSLYELVRLLPRTDYADQSEGRRDPAILAMAERALSIRETHMEQDTAAWMGSLAQVTYLYEDNDRLAEAEAMYTDAIARFSTALGEDHPRVVDMTHSFAILLANNGQNERASAMLEDLVERMDRAAVVDSAALGGVLNDLAWAYGRQDRDPESIPLYERALELARATLGDDLPIVLEPALWNLATNYSGAGRHQEAAALWLEIVENQEAVYGADHVQAATSVPQLALEYVEAGMPDRAVPLLDDAIPILREAADGGEAGDYVSWRLSDAIVTYGMARHDMGSSRFDAEMLDLAGMSPQRRFDVLQRLGSVLEFRGEDESALPVRRLAVAEAAGIVEGDPMDRANRLRSAYIDLAVVFLVLGRAEELLALGDEWVSAMERIQAGDSPITRQALRDMASLLFRGEPPREVPPIESVRAASLGYVQRVIAMTDRMEGDGIHMIQYLAPLRAALMFVGRTDEADAAREEARALISARIEEFDAMRARGELVEAARWNGNCWWAALSELPELALPACDAAVEGATRSELPRHHDSRGIARAQLGDYEGAITDFEVFISANWEGDPFVIQRQRWVDRMRAGEVPFTQEELGALSF